MRRTACLGFVLAAWLVTGAPAAGQTVTVPDVGDTVDQVGDTVDQVGDTVDQVVDTGTSTVDQVAGTAEETAGQATSSGGSAGGSGGSIAGGVLSSAAGTSSSGSTTSSGSGSTASRTESRSGGGGRPRIRTAFDRLPRRVEILLERIELGRNVRANVRRLERMLASASPELRRQVLRQLRAEIARLRRGGVTRAERRRIARLRFTIEALRTSAPGRPQPGSRVVANGSQTVGATGTAVTSGETPGAQGESKNSGVLGTQAGGGVEQPSARPIPFPPAPDRPDTFPSTLGLALLALLILGLAGVVTGVATHLFGRVRSG